MRCKTLEVGTMRRWTVGDVMTETVVSVAASTPYKEIVEILGRHRVSAVPVVDEQDRVVGVVSEADLLHKLGVQGGGDGLPVLLERKQRRLAREKASGDIAAELMTRPAVTIGPHATVSAVARIMDHERIKRLPVVDEQGHLVGIVSRTDLLRVYLREDEAIRVEISDQVLLRTLWIDPGTVHVAVDRGVVTLTGTADRRSTVEIIGRLCNGVMGVVDVVNEIVPAYDDTADLHRRNLMGATVKETTP